MHGQKNIKKHKKEEMYENKIEKALYIYIKHDI